MENKKVDVISALNALIKLEKCGKHVCIIGMAEGDKPNTTILMGCGTFNRTRYFEIKHLIDKLLDEQ